jgi:hypothetical protein
MRFTCKSSKLFSERKTKKNQTKLETLSNLSYKSSIDEKYYKKWTYNFFYLCHLIYLRKKYKNFIGLVSTDFDNWNDIIGNVALFWEPRKKTIIYTENNMQEYKNPNQKKGKDLTVKEIKRLCKKKERFIIIKFGIPQHANIIIFDTKLNLVYYFEPHGFQYQVNYYAKYNYKSLESKLKNFFKSINSNIKIYFPRDYLPREGYQILDTRDSLHFKSLKKKDSDGYCHYWCIFFVNLIIKHPDIPIKNLVKKSMDIIRKASSTKKSTKLRKTDYYRFINNYAQNLEKEFIKDFRHLLRDYNFKSGFLPSTNSSRKIYNTYIQKFNYFSK